MALIGVLLVTPNESEGVSVRLLVVKSQMTTFPFALVEYDPEPVLLALGASPVCWFT